MVPFENRSGAAFMAVSTGSAERCRSQACHQHQGAANLRHTGGAEGDRTPDLVIANDALSQLSYGPVPSILQPILRHDRANAALPGARPLAQRGGACQVQNAESPSSLVTGKAW